MLPTTGTAAPAEATVTVRLPRLHPRQREFVRSTAKRRVVRAGRRSGKTVGVAVLAVETFLAGGRVLYAVPTQEQVDRFWVTVKRALAEPIDAGVYYKNETTHIIERPGTEQRIRAKTAWNSDTLRGDYAHLLILDEYQLMAEDAWGLVGAPMLLDNNGDAVFCYTPPSIRSVGASKARDPLHAAKLFKAAKADTSGRWAAFHFTSHDNPHISSVALREISKDMTARAIRQEIDAEDLEDAPGALWHREDTLNEDRVLYGLDSGRVTIMPELDYIVTAIDPSATSTGDEAGIITTGAGLCGCRGEPARHGFVFSDASLQGSPGTWARAGVTEYNKHHANRLVAESNQGGEMVALTVSTIPNAPAVELIHASESKQVRAEPIAALYEQGRVHHVGTLPELEDELCSWVPNSGRKSPNRLDALVHSLTALDILAGPLFWE